MERVRVFGGAFAGLALFAIAWGWQSDARAGAPKSDSKVKATVEATELDRDGKQMVTITLDIEKEWHIYANPVGADTFEANSTRVNVQAKDKVTATVKYPTGKSKTEVLGKEIIQYFIFDGKVILHAQVQRTVGDTSPLKISIDVNACKPSPDGKNGICLPPGTVQLTLP